MKTYLLNIPNTIRNWSSSLDAKTILTRKSWLVFNDEGVKEVFIFQKDGTLLVSQNGKVTKAKWEYIPVNSSVVIDVPDGETYMLNPQFYDDKVLALQVDGTAAFSVLIDQDCVGQLLLDNIEKIKLYLAEKTKPIEKKETPKEPRVFDDKEVAEWNAFIDAEVQKHLSSPEGQRKLSRLKKTRIVSSIIVMISLIMLLLGFAFKDDGSFETISFIAPYPLMASILVLLIAQKEHYKEDLKSELKEKYPIENFFVQSVNE